MECKNEAVFHVLPFIFQFYFTNVLKCLFYLISVTHYPKVQSYNDTKTALKNNAGKKKMMVSNLVSFSHNVSQSSLIQIIK